MVGLPAYCMENQAVDSPLASIYLLLNTADPGEGYEVFDGDTNHAVFDSFVGILLGKKKTAHNAIFISYGLGARLKEEYEKSIAYFKSLHIEEPLEQVAIQPVEMSSHYIYGNKRDKLVIEKKLLPFTVITQRGDGLVSSTNTQKTVFLKNPNTIANSVPIKQMIPMRHYSGEKS